MECKAAQCLLILLDNMTCKFSWLCATILEEERFPGSSAGKETILEEESFPGSSAGKECACSAGDTCSIPGSGRSPGGGDGIPLQYSCLENPMDREANWATVQGVAQSQTQLKQLSTHAKHNLAHAT